MSSLRLIIGGPRSGKTSRVLTEVAGRLRAPLADPGTPPLLLLVPEQQSAQTERAVLEAVSQQRGNAADVAVAGLAVLSFRWLARRLELEAGINHGPLSEQGRRLLVWRLLGQPRYASLFGELSQQARRETAQVLADALAELADCATGPERLRERAAELEAAPSAQAVAAAAKLRMLAEVAAGFEQECRRRGLSFVHPAARVPTLLQAGHWPGLERSDVWIDGFRDFTPAEERAVEALLRGSRSVTATLLLDPARLEAPLAADHYDWYAPTRAQYARWHALAEQCGAEVQVERLADSAQPPPQLTRRVCTDERSEADAAVLEVRRLALPAQAGGLGLRYGRISIVARDLVPYAALLESRLRDAGIPYFLDQRRALAHHPAVELLRCGLRLSLGLAADDDVYTLLKTGLLPEGDSDGPSADELENFAREHGIAPADWLSETPWREKRRLTRDADRAPDPLKVETLARLDSQRHAMLAPVAELLGAIATAQAAGELTVERLLGFAWTHLLTPVLPRLEVLAAQAEQTGAADAAELHRAAPGALAELLDELVTLAGDLLLYDEAHASGDGLSPAELVEWLERGLAELSVGIPPPRLDCVLITDIERGRHPDVDATLVLGLAEDSWPRPRREGGLFSGAERALLNAGGRLLAGGRERAEIEPYLALVALTRPAQRLYLSRPAGDAEGRGRAPSPFWDGVPGRPADAPEELHSGAALLPNAAGVLVAAAQDPQHAELQRIAAALRPAAADAARGIAWAQRKDSAAQLPPQLVRALLEREAALPVAQLEDFAACPFRHYARHLLDVDERDEARAGVPLGAFYHELLRALVLQLNLRGYPQAGATADEMRQAAREAVAELGQQLTAEQGSGAQHVLERAEALAEQVALQLLSATQEAGRVPTLAGVPFGPGERLSAVEVKTALGTLRLRGRIDRLDVTAGGSATVVDYRTAAGKIDFARLLAGQQLRLPTALLAAEGATLLRPGGPAQTLHAAGAEVQGIEPRVSGGNKPERWHAAEPLLKSPRGAESNPGALLENTLAATRSVLVELAGRLLAGDAAPHPLRHGRWTACNGCAYRALCRFDPRSGDEYREITLTDGAARRSVLDADAGAAEELPR